MLYFLIVLKKPHCRPFDKAHLPLLILYGDVIMAELTLVTHTILGNLSLLPWRIYHSGWCNFKKFTKSLVSKLMSVKVFFCFYVKMFYGKTTCKELWLLG